MIYNKIGQEFIYEGVTYRIGAEIVGSAESDYKGLNGIILEIRTDNDIETDNYTPDIHCYFDPPCLPGDIKDIEKRFSKLYRTEKKLEDIPLDHVIMAPDEILMLSSPRKSIEVYVLEEDWANNDDYGHSTAVFTDYSESKAKLNAVLQEEMNIGCLSDWISDENYQFDTDDNSYEGWIDGLYTSNHYKIALTKFALSITNSVYEKLGREYIDLCHVKDFAEQIECWDEISELTDEQYQELISNKTIPERINKELSMNDIYLECYSESVCEVACKIVSEYISQNTPKENSDNKRIGGD